MPEIVHLSAGPVANYLNAEFYNSQEKYFVYTEAEVKNSLVSPAVNFSVGREFTPRAAFWEFRHGYGSSPKYPEAYQKRESIETLKASHEGRLELLENLTSPSDTWMKQLRVPVHPTSKNEIFSWEHDSTHPRGKLRGALENAEFRYYDQGVEEFSLVNKMHDGEYLDQTVRILFEKCDNLEGVNVNCDFSAWGGWTAVMLECLRDEFSLKVPVFTWASCPYERNKSRKLVDSELEVIRGLSDFSSLVVPLQYDPHQPLTTTAQKQNLLFESISVISSLRTSSTTMWTVLQDLVSDERANIVSGLVASSQSSTSIMDLYVQAPITEQIDFCLDKFLPTRTESKLAVVRPTFGGPLTPNQEKLQWTTFHESMLLENGVQEGRLHKYDCAQAYPLESSYVGPQGMYAELCLNNGPLGLRSLVSPRNHTQKELIYDLTEAYIWGWNSDSD